MNLCTLWLDVVDLAYDCATYEQQRRTLISLISDICVKDENKARGYDQEIPQLQTTDQLMAPRERDT